MCPSRWEITDNSLIICHQARHLAGRCCSTDVCCSPQAAEYAPHPQGRTLHPTAIPNPSAGPLAKPHFCMLKHRCSEKHCQMPWGNVCVLHLWESEIVKKWWPLFFAHNPNCPMLFPALDGHWINVNWMNSTFSVSLVICKSLWTKVLLGCTHNSRKFKVSHSLHSTFVVCLVGAERRNYRTEVCSLWWGECYTCLNCCIWSRSSVPGILFVPADTKGKVSALLRLTF